MPPSEGGGAMHTRMRTAVSGTAPDWVSAQPSIVNSSEMELLMCAGPTWEPKARQSRGWGFEKPGLVELQDLRGEQPWTVHTPPDWGLCPGSRIPERSWVPGILILFVCLLSFPNLRLDDFIR